MLSYIIFLFKLNKNKIMHNSDVRYISYSHIITLNQENKQIKRKRAEDSPKQKDTTRCGNNRRRREYQVGWQGVL